MLVAVAPGPAQGGQPPSGTFDDDDGNVHEPNIELIAAEQITLGCGPRLYCPADNVSRAEMAAFLLRAIDHAGHLPGFQARFDDVPPGQWYTGYAEHLAEHGITQGCSVSPSLYCPMAPVSRAEMAAFILRAIGHADHLPSYQGYFADVPAGLWYTALVEHLYEHGITLGCGGGNYCPNQPVRRDEMASFIARALVLLTPNNTPVCANDSASVDSGQTLNDSVVCTDADAGDTLTYAAVDDVDNGTLTFNSNGTFSYTPDGGFSGADSFTFTANDGTATSTAATFMITVDPPDPPDNLAPIAANDNGGTVSGGCWKLVRGVLTNDSDPDGDPLTITAVSDPANGQAQIVGTFLRYNNDGTVGADSFTYTVSDGTATDTATVSMNVVAMADTDGDGITNACDPFAKVSDTLLPDAPLGFAEEFDDLSGDWNSTGFTGIMTNSLEDSLTQFTANEQNAAGRLVVSASDGEAFSANNTQDNAFQVNIATSPALPDFSIHGRVCQPFPPEDFASAGIFFGPGDQDNYIKAALDWHPTLDVTSVADTREVEGVGVTIGRRTAHRGDPSVPVPDCIELLVNVRVAAGTYHPHYSLDDGGCWYNFEGTGALRTVPSSWLNGTYPLGGTGGSRALAVGITSSSVGPATEFNATWDFLRVDPMGTTTLCP